MSTSPQLRILSLGAGVQSTAMALMAAHGEFEHSVDCAIFCDTGWEPKAVYEHLQWLISDNVGLPFPVHIVKQGNLRDDIVAGVNSTGQKFSAVPWFTINKDGSKGMGRRQCTSEYKINPLQRKIRELLGVKRPKKGAAEVWVGISVDEAHRMRPARVAYTTNVWPLIEKGMNRRDCLAWMKAQGYPEPPKSACIGCPFHSDSQWRGQRDNTPDEWADSILVDHAIRADGEQQFMHVDRVPLGEVDLRTHREMGQEDLFSDFGEECDGMCGV